MGKGKSSGRGGAKYSPPKYGGGRPSSGGGKYNPMETVAVYLTKQTAVDLLNALIIAVGYVPYPKTKGKGKKKDGGGKKHSPKKPYPKPTGTKSYDGKPAGGGKTYRVKPPATKSWGGKPKPSGGGGKYGRGK
jgi:hypothetical protein